MNDPIDDLLRTTGPSASPELREAVWRRTAGQLRRRRPRPIVALALLVTGIAAGLLLWLTPPPRPSDPPAPTQRQALYRQADRHLDEGRPDEAVKCYAQALDDAPREELELSAEDHFLLMAIKHARKKEMDACER